MIELLDIVLNSQDPRQTQWQLEGKSAQLAGMQANEVDQLLIQMVESLGDNQKAWTDSAPSIQLLVNKLSARKQDQTWSNSRLNTVESLYRNAPVEADLRNQLLHWMAASGDDNALKLWANLVTSQPPEHLSLIHI